MTIPKQHSDETVGLPTRASSKICPAFSGCPNDWLSPTDAASTLTAAVTVRSARSPVFRFPCPSLPVPGQGPRPERATRTSLFSFSIVGPSGMGPEEPSILFQYTQSAKECQCPFAPPRPAEYTAAWRPIPLPPAAGRRRRSPPPGTAGACAHMRRNSHHA